MDGGFVFVEFVLVGGVEFIVVVFVVDCWLVWL